MSAKPPCFITGGFVVFNLLHKRRKPAEVAQAVDGSIELLRRTFFGGLDARCDYVAVSVQVCNRSSSDITKAKRLYDASTCAE